MKKSHPFPCTAGATVVIACALYSNGAFKLKQVIAGYTSCNLCPDYGWISSANILGSHIVPAGKSVALEP